MIQDILRRFTLEKANVRGEWVHLDQTWRQLLDRADYPPTIQQLLGQALSAVVLLSATVKHQGSLILQIRGNGPVHLLVVQATHGGKVRGLARWSREPDGQSLADIFGEGNLVITMEAAETGERYQGIIALEGDSIPQALEHYFHQSEQLPTRLWLTSNAQSCAGLLVQRLPNTQMDQDEQDENWHRVSLLLDTVTEAELQQLPSEQLIYRLFHEEEPRVFPHKSIRFQCSCNRHKVETMLQALGQEEANSILEEQGQIEVTCDFCNARYVLDRVDVAQLFVSHLVEPTNPTLH